MTSDEIKDLAKPFAEKISRAFMPSYGHCREQVETAIQAALEKEQKND